MKSMALLIWLVAAAIAALGLFQIKHEVSALEDELTEVQRSIKERREATHILKAEWSYLNQPSRIAKLSRRYLDLAPIGPEQVLRLTDLPLREQHLAATEQRTLDGLRKKAGSKK